MTGEMAWIREDGRDSNGDDWPTHAAIAKALDGILCPFDVYQGPYIKVGKHKLWLQMINEIQGIVYDETFGICSLPFYAFPGTDEDIIEEAKFLVAIE